MKLHITEAYCKNCDIRFYSSEFNEPSKHYCTECGSELIVTGRMGIFVGIEFAGEVHDLIYRKKKSTNSEAKTG